MKHPQQPVIDENAEIRQVLHHLQNSGVMVPDSAAQKLGAYVNLIHQGNQITQLISRTDEGKIIQRHIAECLAPAASIPLAQFQAILDLGTGAGLPGIPLAILFPKTRFTLVDSKRKRVLFLKSVQKKLSLHNAQIILARVEGLWQKEPLFDAVLARAVAELKTLWRWASPLLRDAGVLLAMKGGDTENEIARLQRRNPGVAVEKICYHGKFVDPSFNRHLIVVHKAKHDKKED